MKICVLQPDYAASAVDYRRYDPPRDLTPLLPGHSVAHVFLNKLTTWRQLKRLARERYDIFVNLCEGYLDWDVPSIDVIDALERLNLPYTGPPPHLYDPSKALMKYVAHTVDVRTPASVLVHDLAEAGTVPGRLAFPLFVKPSHAGDSLGIDAQSLVLDEAALLAKVEATLDEFDELLVEEYVDGREFTVLVLASATPRGPCRAFAPVEFRFPAGHQFKTYALKTSELHPSANVPVTDAALRARLQDTACRLFTAFGGVGYARLDFRTNAEGELFFLEINFTCSMFYRDGYEGSTDYILRHDGVGQGGFAELIIAEGMARHRRRQSRYRMEGNSVSGFGIFATETLEAGEVVFRGEEQAHRLVTRQHVAAHWGPDDQRTFRRYAVPLSSEVYALWDEAPAMWSPQNHSCDPNTMYHGLDVVARRRIASGEELTLDYAMMMNEQSEPFACCCGAPSCRGVVRGTISNSVSSRGR